MWAEFSPAAQWSADPGRDERLQPQVVPYAYMLLVGLDGGLRNTPEYLGRLVHPSRSLGRWRPSWCWSSWRSPRPGSTPSCGSPSQNGRPRSASAALGAGRTDLVRSIGRRAFAQIGIGVLLGTPIALDFFNGSDQGVFTGAGWALLVGVTVMVVVGLAACTGPMLRALRVHPSEALRAEG